MYIILLLERERKNQKETKQKPNWFSIEWSRPMYRLLMYLSLALFILTPIVGLGILVFEDVVYGYLSGVHEYFVGGFLLASLLSFVAGIVYGLAKGEDDAVAKLTCVIGVIAFVAIVGLVGADNFRNIIFFIAILSVIAVIIAAVIKK